jgi:hypothetical protein
VTEEQINARLKPGWRFTEKWRGEQDNNEFVADGILQVHKRQYAAAVRGTSLFANLYYNGQRVEI